MSRWTQRREQFRDLLAGERCLAPASVFDPVSARIAAELGYECSMLAGSIASLAVLGAPDIIVLTLSEFADHSCRVTSNNVHVQTNPARGVHGEAIPGAQQPAVLATAHTEAARAAGAGAALTRDDGLAAACAALERYFRRLEGKPPEL